MLLTQGLLNAFGQHLNFADDLLALRLHFLVKHSRLLVGEPNGNECHCEDLRDEAFHVGVAEATLHAQANILIVFVECGTLSLASLPADRQRFVSYGTLRGAGPTEGRLPGPLTIIDGNFLDDTSYRRVFHVYHVDAGHAELVCCDNALE